MLIGSTPYLAQAQNSKPRFGDILMVTEKNPMIQQNVTAALQRSNVSAYIDPQVKGSGFGPNSDLLMIRTAYNRPTMFATKTVPGIQKIYLGMG
jgi:hypothetical protein